MDPRINPKNNLVALNAQINALNNQIKANPTSSVKALFDEYKQAVLQKIKERATDLLKSPYAAICKDQLFHLCHSLSLLVDKVEKLSQEECPASELLENAQKIQEAIHYIFIKKDDIEPIETIVAPAVEKTEEELENERVQQEHARVLQEQALEQEKDLIYQAFANFVRRYPKTTYVLIEMRDCILDGQYGQKLKDAFLADNGLFLELSLIKRMLFIHLVRYKKDMKAQDCFYTFLSENSLLLRDKISKEVATFKTDEEAMACIEDASELTHEQLRCRKSLNSIPDLIRINRRECLGLNLFYQARVDAESLISYHGIVRAISILTVTLNKDKALELILRNTDDQQKCVDLANLALRGFKQGNKTLIQQYLFHNFNPEIRQTYIVSIAFELIQEDRNSAIDAMRLGYPSDETLQIAYENNKRHDKFRVRLVFALAFRDGKIKDECVKNVCKNYLLDVSEKHTEENLGQLLVPYIEEMYKESPEQVKKVIEDYLPKIYIFDEFKNRINAAKQIFLAIYKLDQEYALKLLDQVAQAETYFKITSAFIHYSTTTEPEKAYFFYERSAASLFPEKKTRLLRKLIFYIAQESHQKAIEIIETKVPMQFKYATLFNCYIKFTRADIRLEFLEEVKKFIEANPFKDVLPYVNFLVTFNPDFARPFIKNLTRGNQIYCVLNSVKTWFFRNSIDPYMKERILSILNLIEFAKEATMETDIKKISWMILADILKNVSDICDPYKRTLQWIEIILESLVTKIDDKDNVWSVMTPIIYNDNNSLTRKNLYAFLLSSLIKKYDLNTVLQMVYVYGRENKFNMSSLIARNFLSYALNREDPETIISTIKNCNFPLRKFTVELIGDYMSRVYDINFKVQNFKLIDTLDEDIKQEYFNNQLYFCISVICQENELNLDLIENLITLANRYELFKSENLSKRNYAVYAAFEMLNTKFPLELFLSKLEANGSRFNFLILALRIKTQDTAFALKIIQHIDDFKFHTERKFLLNQLALNVDLFKHAVVRDLVLVMLEKEMTLTNTNISPNDFKETLEFYRILFKQNGDERALRLEDLKNRLCPSIQILSAISEKTKN